MTSYGVFVDIGGVDGMVHISELSWSRIKNPAEVVSVGDKVNVYVISFDPEKKKISLGMKDHNEDPWEKFTSTYEVGSVASVRVVKLMTFGAFAEIVPGVDGLIHVTELAWGRVKHPSDVLKIGDEIEVLILAVDPEKERVSLSYKQLQPKPWTTAAERYPVGSIVEGKVVRIVPFGAFVSLEPTIDGLIHISQVATTRIAKVEDELKVGDIIRAKVLDVNPEGKRISLSRREVLIDEMPEIEDIVEDGPLSDMAASPARDEDEVVIPPVESATTSLADLFPKLDD